MGRSASRFFVMLCVILAPLTNSYQVNVTSLAARQELESGTILLHKGDELWTLDPISLSLEKYLSLGYQPDSQSMSVTISPEGKFVFLMEWENNIPGSVAQLTRIDGISGLRTVLFSRPGLIGMTDVSPGNEWAILIYSGESTNEPIAWRFCLLNIKTAACPDIDLPYINRSDFFWIDDLSFVTISSDTVSVYILDETGIADRRILQQEDWRFVTSDLVPETRALLIGSYQKSSPAEPVFIVVDLHDLTFSTLPFGVASYYGAVFNDVMVSPDKQLLLYKRAEHLNVVDFRQGTPVFELDNVRQVVWSQDGKRLIIISKSFDSPFLLTSVDPSIGALSEQLSFDETMELYMVY